MTGETVRQLASLMRQQHGANAERYVQEQVRTRARKNETGETLSLWIQVLALLTRQIGPELPDEPSAGGNH